MRFLLVAVAMVATATCFLGCRSDALGEVYNAAGVASVDDVTAVREEAVETDQAFLNAIQGAPEDAEVREVLTAAAQSRVDSSRNYVVAQPAGVSTTDVAGGGGILTLLWLLWRSHRKRDPTKPAVS